MTRKTTTTLCALLTLSSLALLAPGCDVEDELEEFEDLEELEDSPALDEASLELDAPVPATETVSLSYWEQPRLNTTIRCALETLATSSKQYTAEMPAYTEFEIKDHHQSQEMSHRFSDDSRLVFISHSEVEGVDQAGKVFIHRSPASMWNLSADTIKTNAQMPRIGTIEMSEKHPSGLAWLPGPNNGDFGYLFVAGYEHKIRIYKVFSDGTVSYWNNFIPEVLSNAGDVWLASIDGYLWMILYNANDGLGEAYRAAWTELMPNPHGLHLSSFKPVNDADDDGIADGFTIDSVGCANERVGANAEIVQGLNGQYWVVNSYNDSGSCGAGFGNPTIEARRVRLGNDASPKFEVDDDPEVTQVLPWVTDSWQPSADGAAGFRITPDGRLITMFGAQFSFAGKSKLLEYRTPYTPPTCP